MIQLHKKICNIKSLEKKFMVEEFFFALNIFINK